MLPGDMGNFLDLIVNIVSTLQQCKVLRHHYHPLGSKASTKLLCMAFSLNSFLRHSLPFIQTHNYFSQSPCVTRQPSTFTEKLITLSSCKGPCAQKTQDYVGLATFRSTGLKYFLPNKPWIKMTKPNISQNKYD